MTTSLTNIPYANISSSDPTVQAFNNYYASPIELHSGTLNALTGFFTSRGFEETSAQTISVIIMTQAKKDRLNPMSILDTLGGYQAVEVSAFVTTLLNFNRYKTSFLGFSLTFRPRDVVARNIIA
jgi:hypothetical protein